MDHRGAWSAGGGVVMLLGWAGALGWVVAVDASSDPHASVPILPLVLLIVIGTIGCYWMVAPLLHWWPWRGDATMPTPRPPISKSDLRFEDEVEGQTVAGFTLRLRIRNVGFRKARLYAQVVDADGGPRSLGNAPPWILAGIQKPPLLVPPDGGQASLDFASTSWYLRRASDGVLVWVGNPDGPPAKPTVSIAIGVVTFGGGVIDYVGQPIHITIKVWNDETDELVGEFRYQVDFEEVPGSAAVSGHLRPTLFRLDRD